MDFLQVFLSAGTLLTPAQPAAQPAALEAAEYPKTLEFSEFTPCRGNASFCGTRILAKGEFDAGAPERLKRLLVKFDYRPTIVFDSPGGSLTAGLAVGEIIRARGLNTEVGPEYVEEVLASDQKSTQMLAISASPICMSACTYAFMGGKSRSVLEGARIGVHQFAGAKLDAESLAQSMTAVVSQYMLSMGVDRELLDVASLTKSDSIELVSRLDAQRVNLDNQAPKQSDWELIAMEGGIRAARVVQQMPGSDSKTTVLVMTDPTAKFGLIVMVGLGPLPNRSARPDLQSESVSICSVEKRCVRLKPIENWKVDQARDLVVGIFQCPLADFAGMASGSLLSLDPGIPRVLSDFAPSVDLGTRGLRNALLALY